MRRRFTGILLCLCMALMLLPTCAFAAGNVNDRGTLGIYWTGSNYDVRGLAQGSDPTNPTIIKTTFNNDGYKTVLRHAGATHDVNFTAANTSATVSGVTGLSAKVDYAFVSAGRYLQITYTLINDSDTDITGLDIGAHADIMIGSDDYASIYRTDTGFRMVNTKTNPAELGYNKQFNLVCKGGMGVVDVSTMWFGHYSDRQTKVFEDTAASQLTGTDSGLAFSWKGMTVPASSDGVIPGRIVRSLLFSISEQGMPPEIPAGGRPQLYLQAAGQKMIIVNAKVRDTAGLTDMLYYTINNSAEQAIGSVVADGGEKTLAGYIDLTSAAPNDYALQMWIMNSLGVMSEVVEKTIRINANNSIDEVTSDGVVTLAPAPDSVVRPLDAPASPAWDASGGVVSATWNAVAGATSYYVQLYDASGNECGTALEATDARLDCTAALSQQGSGSYTFKVIAASATASSLPSDSSGSYTFTIQGAPGGTLNAPLTQAQLDAVFGAGGATLDPNNGVVTLQRSAVLAAPIRVETDVTLNLNGFTLTGPNGQSAIAVSGSAALSLENTNTSERSTVSGGAGVAGGNGGAAIEAGGGSVSVGANVTVQGGSGGNNNDGYGGNGGSGVNADGSIVDINVDNGGVVAGGTGGTGGNGGNGGNGGSGVSTGGSITNNGVVSGGDGGDSGNGNGGTGGAGASAGGSIVNNTGSTVTGGSGGAGGGSGNGGNGGTGSRAGGSVSGSGTTSGGTGGAAGQSGGTPGNAGEPKQEHASGDTSISSSVSAPGGMVGGGYTGDQYLGAWQDGVLTVQADCNKLVSVTVDGVQLAKNTDYTVKCGSTVVTFAPAYLATLKDGAHTIRVQFTDGRCDGAFTTPFSASATTASIPDVPATGGAEIGIAPCALALLGLSILSKRRYAMRRQKHAQ